MSIEITTSSKEKTNEILHGIAKLYSCEKESGIVSEYRELLERYPEALVIAVENNEIVGCMACVPVKEWYIRMSIEAEAGEFKGECIGDYNGNSHVVLKSIIVSDEYRDTGLAYKIFDSAILNLIDRAKGGTRIADITCLVTSEDGKKMVERLGFSMRSERLAVVRGANEQAA